MRLVLVSLFVAVPAGAQPVTQPETCEVTIARAPDDVRATIEQWLVGEHCTVPLEVRVVPTEGGLYLLARDGRGRERERVVPDAQSAGVLVASWAADDGLGPQPAIAPPAPAPVERPWFVPQPEHDIRLAPPSTIVPAREPVDGGGAVRRHTGWRWLGLSVLQGDTGRGARATIDLAGSGRWTIGLAAAVSTTDVENNSWPGSPGSYNTPGFLSLLDTRGVGYVTRTFGDGVWTIRTSLGAGLVWTRVAWNQMSGSGWDAVDIQYSDSSWSGMVEASVLVGRDLGDAWGVDAGLVTSFYGESVQVMPDVSFDHATDWELAVGLRHRL